MTDTGKTRTCPPDTLGDMLRRWRRAAGLSQLDLALDLGTSTRHLSFLESGRAQPSEPMLSALMQGLDIPPAERNTLRLAAGLKPLPYATAPEPAQRGQVRRIIEQVKAAHSGVPLLVKDRIWDIIDANDPARRLFADILGEDVFSGSEPLNVLELVFAPAPLRRKLTNWDEVADATVRHVRHETGMAADDPAFQAVLARVSAMPGFSERWARPETGAADHFSTRYIFDLPGGQRAFDSILMSLGAPYEAILSGIRFDTFHAADQNRIQ